MFRIFLAEDSHFAVRDLTRKLRVWDEPYELTVVHDGQAAADYLMASARGVGEPLPDLVILDLKLPRIDGLEVLGLIREMPELRALPVLVLTTSDSPFDMDLAEVMQVNAYLTKGADANTICRLVARNVRRAMPAPLAADAAVGAGG